MQSLAHPTMTGRPDCNPSQSTFGAGNPESFPLRMTQRKREMVCNGRTIFTLPTPRPIPTESPHLAAEHLQ